jgi:hypothetical protein
MKLRALGEEAAAMFNEIVIHGGLGDDLRHATVLFPDKREENFGIEPGEILEAFRDRVVTYAEGRGADSVVFGGLD